VQRHNMEFQQIARVKASIALDLASLGLLANECSALQRLRGCEWLYKRFNV